jgi:hypothetical protein
MKLLLSLLACLYAIPSYAVQAQTAHLPSNYVDVINKWIKHDNIRTKPRWAPYAEIDGDSVYIYIGDLDSDGDDDCLASYNMAFGGNSVTQIWTVFLNNNGKLSKGYKHEVGFSATGGEMMNEPTIRNSVIECTTTIWKEDDAGCCPTGEGQAKYVFSKKKLKRL